MHQDFVKTLVKNQFPEWGDLSIIPLEPSGWDHYIFRLGKEYLIRLPRSKEYSYQVKKEFEWLPKLSSRLPLAIPNPLKLGSPTKEFPYPWGIYRWIEGENVLSQNNYDLSKLAPNLAEFLLALQTINTSKGPTPGRENFYRGGDLRVYDTQARRAIAELKGRVNTAVVINIWEEALKTSWSKKAAWVHGDISVGNLLLFQGNLHAVIDFGLLAVGDPACDFAIAWTWFDEVSRRAFLNKLCLDEGTIRRAQAWALWKALIVAAEFSDPGNFESIRCWEILDVLQNNGK